MTTAVIGIMVRVGWHKPAMQTHDFPRVCFCPAIYYLAGSSQEPKSNIAQAPQKRRRLLALGFVMLHYLSTVYPVPTRAPRCYTVCDSR